MLRIVSAAAVVAFVVAGCGGAARSERTTARQIPRALARAWADQASAVAGAAATGDDCHALQLASSLRDDVIQQEPKVPVRLRSQLLAGVNALADRITCQVPPQTVTVPPQGPPKPPHKKPPPKHHDHPHPPKPGDNQGNG